MDEYLDLISINIWHIIASGGNLLLLTWILKKFLFKPVTEVLLKRERQVSDIYSEAEEKRERAELDRIMYKSKLSSANGEAEEIVKCAVERADKLGKTIIDEAKQKAEATRKKAEADIALEKKRAMNELVKEISEISVQIAENVVGREISQEDHRAYIDSFIDEL